MQTSSNQVDVGAVGRPTKDTIQITLRIPSVWLEKADALAKQIAPPGADFGRPDAFRAAIAKGLEEFERDRLREEERRGMAMPAGLTQRGVVAYEIISRFLQRHRLTYSGGSTIFQSPRDWRTTHPDRYSTGPSAEVLIVVYDGSDARRVFDPDAHDREEERSEKLVQELKAEGFYWERDDLCSSLVIDMRDPRVAALYEQQTLSPKAIPTSKRTKAGQQMEENLRRQLRLKKK